MSVEGFTRIPTSSAYHLLHPRPVVIVVSLDSNGKPNGMTAAWITPVSMKPPLITVSIAPRRYTYKLIKETGDFTVNVLDVNLVGEVLEAYVKPGMMKRGIYDPKVAKVLMHLGGVGYVTVADEIINP